MATASRWRTCVAILVGSLTATGCFSGRQYHTGYPTADGSVVSHSPADCTQCRNQMYMNRPSPDMAPSMPSGPVAKQRPNGWNTARPAPMPNGATPTPMTMQPGTNPSSPQSASAIQQTAFRGGPIGRAVSLAKGGQVAGDTMPGSPMPGQPTPPPPGYPPNGPLGAPVIPHDPNAPPMPHDLHPVPPEIPGPGPIPTEISRVSLPPYTVAPPDILYIDAIRLVPKPPYFIEPLEVLTIAVAETLPGQPIGGDFIVAPEGTVNLGFSYGAVRIGGLTLDQANAAIRSHLGKVLRNPEVTVALKNIRVFQQVRGEHLIRPDGTISLGTYGSVYVAGLTIGQIKCVLERYLCDYFIDPKISVDVFAYNSKVYYVIIDGAGYGQQVVPIPITGNETVLDAVSKVGGLAQQSSKRRIWVARPSPCGNGCNQILPVDWRALTEGGSTCTNYQIFPGDRIYIAPNPLIRLDNVLAQVIAPIERVLGVTFLGVSTYQAFNGNLFGNNN